MFHVPEEYRVLTGPLASDLTHGNNGTFRIRLLQGQVLYVIASDGFGWEHVSVSRSDRCPTWGEMCQIKCLFWDDEDCVVQYHPPLKEYVNNHPFCLHLFRPIGADFPMPPSILVGVKG